MAKKLSDLDESWKATDVVNMLDKNDNFKLGDSGGGHGQAWSLKSNSAVSGSIPLNAHGGNNLKAAIKVLMKARKDHRISD